MTIQVEEIDPATDRRQLHLMPVIRHPNFSDRTADLSPDDFYLLVGNEKGRTLERVTLTDFLADIRRYLLFNYQSHAGDPAVLTILATREGTSVTVIDNKRDGFAAGWSWGQRLFFNQNGERASLTGSRESEHTDPVERDDRSSTGTSAEAAGESGLNMVLLIQVPLKQKRPMMQFAMEEMDAVAAQAPAMLADSDVENAVIGHGAVEGPFTEIDDLAIERDPNLPIRVTVQFYKATSNGAVDERDVESIAAQLERVYADADFVGSLVVAGETGRPTEYDGPEDEPAGWWSRFWRRHFGNMRSSR